MNRVDQSQASKCGTGYTHTHTQSICRRPSALRAVGLEKQAVGSKYINSYSIRKMTRFTPHYPIE
jgi:hypothetical protein